MVISDNGNEIYSNKKSTFEKHKPKKLVKFSDTIRHEKLAFLNHRSLPAILVQPVKINEISTFDANKTLFRSSASSTPLRVGRTIHYSVDTLSEKIDLEEDFDNVSRNYFLLHENSQICVIFIFLIRQDNLFDESSQIMETLDINPKSSKEEKIESELEKCKKIKTKRHEVTE